MELRPVINVAIMGCVSTGKSTFLNMLMTNMFSDCHRKRTTMMPQVYREITDFESATLLRGNKSEYTRELSDLDNIRANNTAVNESMKDQAKSGTSINIKDIKPIEYIVPKIKGFAKLASDPSISEVTLAIYDLPGLNDSLSKKSYFEYIQANFDTYDIIIFMVDINSAMNTSDEMDILNIILLGLQKNIVRCRYQKLLILINKCDELNDSIEPLPLDSELLDMYHQCKSIITSRCKELSIHLPQFACISCEDAFIYRMIKDNQFDKLDEKYINRIGHLEFNAREWKKLTLPEKKLRVGLGANTTEGLVSSGFTHFVKLFDDILSGDNQFLYLTQHIDDLIRHNTKDYKKFDIREELLWFKRINVKRHLIQELFKPTEWMGVPLCELAMELFVIDYISFITKGLINEHSIENIQKYLGVVQTFPFLNEQVENNIKQAYKNRMGAILLNNIKGYDIKFDDIMKCIHNADRCKLDICREIRDMFVNIDKYKFIEYMHRVEELPNQKQFVLRTSSMGHSAEQFTSSDIPSRTFLMDSILLHIDQKIIDWSDKLNCIAKIIVFGIQYRLGTDELGMRRAPNLNVERRIICDMLLLKAYKSRIKYTDKYYPIFIRYKQQTVDSKCALSFDIPFRPSTDSILAYFLEALYGKL